MSTAPVEGTLEEVNPIDQVTWPGNRRPTSRPTFQSSVPRRANHSIGCPVTRAIVLEVPVVVEEDCVVQRRDRRDEQIRWPRASVLRHLVELGLNFTSRRRRALVELKLRKRRKLIPEHPRIAR